MSSVIGDKKNILCRDRYRRRPTIKFTTYKLDLSLNSLESDLIFPTISTGLSMSELVNRPVHKYPDIFGGISILQENFKNFGLRDSKSVYFHDKNKCYLEGFSR